MKLKFVFLFLLIATLSCENNDDNSSDEPDVNAIKGEIKKITGSVFKGCEEANFNMVIESCYDSPDFTYLFNGTTLSYTEFTEALKAIFNKLLNQDITLIDEKFAVLDDETVLYTTNCTFLQNFRDGTANYIHPAAMLFIFRKIEGRWRWIYGVESYGQ